MARPETVHDVVEQVRGSRLVGEADIARFLARSPASLTFEAMLRLLVVEGLLTPFQAEELAGGRGRGLVIGAYKLLDRLGKGGMGQVFLAEHGVLAKRFAMKVLSLGMGSDPSARHRFVREVRAAAAIDHPNVVRVHDVDMDHDPPFFVMEYVDGVSLQAAVARNGTLAAGEVAAIGTEVARGLQAAAAVGLVHRDIKPANLLIDRRGAMKILDLGIARFFGDDTQPRLDPSEVIVGTLDYLAPEQAVDSGAVDGRADLYALGATLYFLLAGHPPFPGNDLRHKLAAKQYSDPPPIHRLRPDVNPALSAVVQRLMDRDPAGRYQRAWEVAEVLAPFAILPSDFPARLFRGNTPSTVSDGNLSLNESSSLPVTQRIPKPAPRDRAFEPLILNPAITHHEEGPPTARIAKSPTDRELTPLPRDAIRDRGGLRLASRQGRGLFVWAMALLTALGAVAAAAWSWR